MKVEILETLKGSTTWRKGTIFDDSVSPIPGDIIKEVSSGSRAVRVMAEDKFAVTKNENEIIKPVEIADGFEWAELPPAVMPPQEKTSTRQQETVDSENKCPKCGWTGKTPTALKRHITMVHKK